MVLRIHCDCCNKIINKEDFSASYEIEIIEDRRNTKLIKSQGTICENCVICTAREIHYKLRNGK